MRNHKLIYYVIGVLCFFALSAAVPSICSGPPPFSMQVSGIRIVKDGYQDEWELLPFGWAVGTSLTCLLICNEGHIIALDPTRSKIEKLEDNMGTDLTVDNEGSKNGFWPFCQISKDLKALKFTINGLRLPEKGATSIIASGVLAVKAGYNLKTVKHSNVAIKPGTVLKAPDITISITEVKNPDWTDEPLEIRLESHYDLRGVPSIQFTGPDGAEVKSRWVGYGSKKGPKITYILDWVLSKHLEKADVVVTYWGDVKEIPFPFTIDTSVGL